MQLIKTEMVDPLYDALWEDAAAVTEGAELKPVLVLVNSFEQGTNEGQQLQRMLDACKLTAVQYNVIQLQQTQLVAWHMLREKLDPGIIFLIGIAPAQLGISALFSLNHPNNFDGRIWLPTLSLKELAQHEDVKKQLWSNGMKPLFVDKPLPSSTKER